MSLKVIDPSVLTQTQRLFSNLNRLVTRLLATKMTNWSRARIGGLVLAACLSSAAQAAEIELSECAFADEPTIADGTTADQDAMTATATEVRGYMGAMQDSLSCLEQAEKDLGDDITDEQKLAVTAAYNAGVDKLNAIASAYNEQVRAFKNR